MAKLVDAADSKSVASAVAISIFTEHEKGVKSLINNNQKIFIPPELADRFKGDLVSDCEGVTLGLC